MEQGKGVCWLFVPSYQNTPKAMHPGMGPFHDPAPGFLARGGFERLRLLAPRPPMRREAQCLQGVSDVLRVVTLVQAHARRLRLRGLRALDDDAIERRAHPCHVVPVCPIDHQSHGHAVPCSQQPPLDPAFGSVCGIRTRFFFLHAGPWPAPRPCAANSSPSLGGHPIVRPRLARIVRKRPLPPRPAIGHGRWIWHTTRSGGGLPMGTPCVARRKGPPRHGGPTRAVGRRQSDGCSPAPGAVVQGQSSGPPRDGIPSSCGCWVCEFVFVLWFVVRDSYLIV